MNWKQLRTQKARGVAWLAMHGSQGYVHQPGTMPLVGMASYPNTNIYVFPWDLQAFNKLPAFARPCPTRPRHGFVDSRLVKEVGDVAKIVQETFAEERDAEILVMPKYSAMYSAVLTPSSLAIGKGNDGVTGGKSTLVSIPLPLPSLEEWNFKFSGQNEYKLEDGSQEHIYLEAVEDDGKMRAVQARPGPVLSGLSDFIPRDEEVKSVFSLGFYYDSISLLAWEKMVKEWKGQDGIVVWAPGSSLTSHYAVHCIQNGVAFLTRKEPPKVGDMLKKAAPPKITSVGRLAFKKEMEERIAKKDYRDEGAFVAHHLNTSFALSVAHAHSVWGNGGVFAKLRVRGLIHLLRYTAIGCIGEARHFHGSGPGRALPDTEHKHPLCAEDKREPTLPWPVIHPDKVKLENHPLARDTVYYRLYKHSMEELMEWVVLAGKDLKQPGWIPGMGGDKWAAAAQACKETWDALQTFLAEPDGKNWRRLCQHWNKLAFAVHNGGGILNKWCGHIVDVVSSYPGIGLLGAYKIVLEEVQGIVPVPEEKEEVIEPEVEPIEVEEAPSVLVEGTIGTMQGVEFVELTPSPGQVIAVDTIPHK